MRNQRFLLALALLGTAASAQSPRKSSFSLLGKALLPADTLHTQYKAGWAIGIASEARIAPAVLLTGELSYGRLNGKSFTAVGVENSYRDLDVGQVSVGAKFFPAQPRVYIGAEVAYDWYSLANSDGVTLDDVNTDSDVGFVPAIGVKAGRFDVGAQYRLGKKRWTTIRVALRAF